MLFQLLGISHRCIQMNSMFCLRNFFGFIWKQSPFPHCVLMLSKWSDSDLSSQAGNFLWYKVFFILSKIWLSPLHKLLLRKDPHKIRIFSFRHSIQFMKRTFEFTRRRTRSRTLSIFDAAYFLPTVPLFEKFNSTGNQKRKRKKSFWKLRNVPVNNPSDEYIFFGFQICEHRATHSQVADCKPRRNCLPCYENSKEIR